MSDPITRTGPEWATANGDTWAELWEHTDQGLQGLSSHLLSASLEGSPKDGFRAFEVGCGAGSTAIALADARPDASIVACDISPALVRAVIAAEDARFCEHHGFDLEAIEKAMKANAAALGAGALFGVGLAIAGMTRPEKVAGL